MDDPQAPFPRGGGSLDLVSASRVRPTPPGPSAGRGAPPALAEASSGGETDPCSCTTGLFAPLADVGPSGVRAKTLRTLARATQRAAIETGQTVSCDQIDRVITPKTEGGASFTDFFLNVGSLLLVKWQVKAIYFSSYSALFLHF